MNLDEKYTAAKALTDPAARKLALAIVETEYRIETINERLEKARKRVEEAAARPTASGYADHIEGWLRDWREEYARLIQETRALELLNHLSRTPA